MPTGVYKRTKPISEITREKLRKRIPWNKDKKGLQTPWNKGTIGIMTDPWNKGIPMSSILKEQISQSRKGKCLGNINGFRKGLIPWNKNKQYFAIMGNKNPLWKGGITPINEKIRKSFDLQNWRINIFQRDKYLCQMPDCDKTERFLNAHHIKPFAFYSELRVEITNGITLCKKCHDKTKGREEIFERMFIEIVKLTTTSGATKATCTLRVTETI